MVLTAGPAAAGGNTTCTGTSANAPDARMRLAGGEWEGGNEYPVVPPGKRTGIITVQIRNKEDVFQSSVELYGHYSGNPNPTVNCDSAFATAND